jgi:hypothetical protein
MPEQELSPTRAWPRVERLNAARLADALHVQTGLRLDVQGPCPGGEVGAAYVRRPDGHLAVLTWQPHGKLTDVKHGSLAIAEALRAVAYPVPATELAGHAGLPPLNLYLREDGPGFCLHQPLREFSLRMAHWAIRHFEPADVDYWLDLAELRVG